MKWRDYVSGLEPKAQFCSPASRVDIDEMRSALGVTLPEELAGLLGESNGVYGQYSLGLVWNCERIIADNILFRNSSDFNEIYMPFSHLFFFADAGNGDQFAYSIHADGRIHKADIFVWNHEDDSRTWVAPSLKLYLDWWLTGKLKI